MRRIRALFLVCALSLCAACGDLTNPAVDKVARCSEAATYTSAERFSEAADRALAAGDVEAVNRNAQAGIRVIGDAASDPSALDDTGPALAIAFGEEKDGRIDHAAHLRLNVLKSRLESLKRRLNGCPRT
jgi:hypothetical protein